MGNSAMVIYTSESLRIKELLNPWVISSTVTTQH